MNSIIKAAYKAAQKSTHRFRLGAVIYRKNKILGIGYNRPKQTHPKANTPWRTVHAEFDAAIGVEPEKLKGASIYVLRLKRTGEIGLAKPCRHCTAMLINAGIDKVTWSNNSEKKYVS